MFIDIIWSFNQFNDLRAQGPCVGAMPGDKAQAHGRGRLHGHRQGFVMRGLHRPWRPL